MPRWPALAVLTALIVVVPASSAPANPTITVDSALQPGSTSVLPLTARHVLTLTAGATPERLTVNVNPVVAMTVANATEVPETSATGPGVTTCAGRWNQIRRHYGVPLREPARGRGDLHDRGGPDRDGHRRRHAHPHPVRRRHARRRMVDRARAGPAVRASARPRPAPTKGRWGWSSTSRSSAWPAATWSTGRRPRTSSVAASSSGATRRAATGPSGSRAHRCARAAGR